MLRWGVLGPRPPTRTRAFAWDRQGTCFEQDRAFSRRNGRQRHEGTMAEEMLRVIIEGEALEIPASSTIIQAYVFSGQPLLNNVGCMGQGVCGSCRCMVRRAGSREVKTELAC